MTIITNVSDHDYLIVEAINLILEKHDSIEFNELHDELYKRGIHFTIKLLKKVIIYMALNNMIVYENSIITRI